MSQSMTSGPAATPPSTRSPGTTALDNSTTAVASPPVTCCGRTVTPGSDGATTKTAGPSGVVAGTSTRSAIEPASAVVLVPLSSQPSLHGSAIVAGS